MVQSVCTQCRLQSAQHGSRTSPATAFGGGGCGAGYQAVVSNVIGFDAQVDRIKIEVNTLAIESPSPVK